MHSHCSLLLCCSVSHHLRAEKNRSTWSKWLAVGSQVVVASRLEQVDIIWRCQAIKKLTSICRWDTKIFIPRCLMCNSTLWLWCFCKVILTKSFSNWVFLPKGFDPYYREQIYPPPYFPHPYFQADQLRKYTFWSYTYTQREYEWMRYRKTDISFVCLKSWTCPQQDPWNETAVQ